MQENKKPTFKERMKMETQELCESAIKNGWIAALVSFTFTLIGAVSGFFIQGSDAASNFFLNPWLMIDVVLIAILAFFIYKKSRIAATLMFGYFLFSKISMWYDLGTMQGFPVALIFIYFFFNAMRGTFIWHSRYKDPRQEEGVQSTL